MESDEHKIIQHFSKLQGAHLETHVYVDAYGIVKLLKGQQQQAVIAAGSSSCECV